MKMYLISSRVNEILTKSHRRGTSTFENTATIERGRNEDVVSADNDMGLSHKVLSETAGVGTSNQDLWLLDGVDAKTRRFVNFDSSNIIVYNRLLCCQSKMDTVTRMCGRMG